MTEGAVIIDVWDVETVDGAMRGDLDDHADLVRNYIVTSRQQCLEVPDHSRLYLGNPYAGELIWAAEHTMRLMEARALRAWHYSRLIR